MKEETKPSLLGPLGPIIKIVIVCSITWYVIGYTGITKVYYLLVPKAFHGANPDYQGDRYDEWDKDRSEGYPKMEDIY